MSAITLVNDVPSSISPAAEFRVSQGSDQIARIGVQAGGRASIPTTTSATITQPGSSGQIVSQNNNTVVTAQQWMVYAIANGITTSTVAVTNPNATVTVANNSDDGFSLTVS